VIVESSTEKLSSTEFGNVFETNRAQLLSYITRMVRQVPIAEELVQETALRGLEHLSSAPIESSECRKWLFRIATNLAIDHCRKKGPVSDSVLETARTLAERKPRFIELAQSLHGHPEMVSIAREHLVACFSCVLGRFVPEHAAALLLREVYDFSTQEIADILDATFAQVKIGFRVRGQR
jgi:RNA polymerase sigma-70 factor, ECF subfamily